MGEVNQRIIYGINTDKDGRCVHYHSDVDVIANKCARCQKFYACYKCHDELEDHPFEPVDSNEEATAMCGVCGKLYSYKEYSCLSKCTGCSHEFNPKCSLHKSIYAK